HSGRFISIAASGRTDAHVHALGQVFHFESDLIMEPEKWKYRLNCMLPKDIRIQDVSFEKEDFHARFSCISKRYDYYISTSDLNPFVRNYMLIEKRPLDIEKMKQAASVFIGTHDFTSFTSSKIHEEKSRIRTISECSVYQKDEVIQLIFKGDGFLLYQVRIMAAVIIEAGLHHLEIEDVKEMLEAKDKHVCRYKADPCGLYLVEVNY
ncbi:MAG: tRNA pseudouridine(38-40) synthase TruA, partial [Traorella sp.]